MTMMVERDQAGTAGAMEREAQDRRGAAVVAGRGHRRRESRRPSAGARVGSVAATVPRGRAAAAETPGAIRRNAREAGTGESGRARDEVGTRRDAPLKKGARGRADEVEVVAACKPGHTAPVSADDDLRRVVRVEVERLRGENGLGSGRRLAPPLTGARSRGERGLAYAPKRRPRAVIDDATLPCGD